MTVRAGGLNLRIQRAHVTWLCWLQASGDRVQSAVNVWIFPHLLSHEPNQPALREITANSDWSFRWALCPCIYWHTPQCLNEPNIGSVLNFLQDTVPPDVYSWKCYSVRLTCNNTHVAAYQCIYMLLYILQ